jgi:hypothetical protein
MAHRKRKRLAQTCTRPVVKGEEVAMALQFFGLEGDIFKPTCRLEFFSVGTPK